ncbi:DUF1801 domain-containing protein [Arthrobacter echini]|uniref:DUF1801 domain-containing protein n=1 Tax=Arthrobacter echini TaxID=1529066 RepID=A0A5D0XWI5_9MICC|nr:DUF1801 domain-containing protein [Arthrobacter echini]TYD00372.1 DUF1801 domain-containing protein [Arthrobacter echini]
MAELLTQPTSEDPRAFIEAVEHPRRRADALTLLGLMESVTGEPPVMWESSMIGFGEYRYTYPSGHKNNSLAVGFSPRASALALYGLLAAPSSDELLESLGKHRRGVGCLYITSLASVDLEVLEELVRRGAAFLVTENFT